ncbi:MAG TPA: phosphonate metabolism transcriptional regulator PhnF [Firmicutes bacterium]|jgi:GntR family transcriptional regulator|nr:phosphonate metabolism transcriptional regulator PhnF [Bacillota bacterium]HAW69896.1 phosphonate metabolism transcriptional regulator PhnF [Bacillota bacterium]HAZ22683.1 phosphonate metabolism transcriptional regulator PhnF [Bacillota bacterium]HBE05577.1 phosphonate metabolism transcriptional regulator PhnF [Bacillota bacterium]HBG42902.1 phosphonate metabolism transcriptional regulator PhnF [Bacillota bacterium]
MFENNGVPLYLQLYKMLKEKVKSGEWPENEAIPPEKILMEQYDVGRETVRRSVLRLVNEGYLYRRRGKGTFVCRQRPEDGMEQLVSFSSEMVARGYKPGAIVLEHDTRCAPEKVRAELCISKDTPLLYFKRLRTADELPVAVETSYLLLDVVGPIDRDRLSGSIYQYFVYDKGLKPGRIVQEISSTIADDETADLLGIKKGHPVLQLYRLMYTVDGRPFFYMVFRYRGDVYSIKTNMDLPL